MTEQTEPTVGSVNILDIITEGRELPKGCDHWAMRSARLDLRSSNGYRWPYPGKWAKASGPFYEDNTDGCPAGVGDGICGALTFQGMASGGVSARLVLLLAYADADVLGLTENEGKFRARRIRVVDTIDMEMLLRTRGRSANLRSANLRYADLRSADLRYADLGSADLGSANLGSANLRSANLRSANLGYADLCYADLCYADLGSANLGYADLRSANLRSADLRYANLCYANLGYADLCYADLHGATYNSATLFPEGFDPVARGMVEA